MTEYSPKSFLQRWGMRSLLAIPLGLFGATFAFFGVLVGTAIGGILLVIASVYFGLAAGVLFTKDATATHTACVILGVIAILLAAKLATSKAPW